jgi:predicted RND superfamily exporter protein
LGGHWCRSKEEAAAVVVVVVVVVVVGVLYLWSQLLQQTAKVSVKLPPIISLLLLLLLLLLFVYVYWVLVFGS